MANTIETVRELVDLHSDLYKEANNFRPRLDIDWAVVNNDIDGMVSYMEGKIDGLLEDAKREALRQQREKALFEERVRSVGLDPAKYAALCG